MHVLISAAAPHAGQPGIAIPHHVATALLALLAALAIVIVLKVIGRILSPKKKNSPRTSSPYGSTRR